MSTFEEMVTGAFGFLASEYGFERAAAEGGTGEAVEYRKEPLTILFGWHKGEIDIDFSVSLEFTENHAVFRPFLSRTFLLREVARRVNPHAFDALTRRPELRDYITTGEAAEAFLEECARVMRRTCAPLLAGDLTMLEEITRERSNRE